MNLSEKLLKEWHKNLSFWQKMFYFRKSLRNKLFNKPIIIFPCFLQKNQVN